MLKSILSISIFTMLAHVVPAQSVDEAEKLMYYERYNSAENALHTVLQKNAEDAKAWYWLGQAYLQQNKVAEGKDSLTKAPASVINEPLFQVGLGHYLLVQGDANSAKSNFDKALKQTKEKDENILAAVARAHIHAKQGNANYAIEMLNKAIKRDKRNPELYALKGDVYRKLDNGSEAYKAYH